MIQKLRRKYNKLKIKKAARKELRDSDVVVISFPKSGRTWLRVLVGRYLTLKYGIGEKSILQTYELTKQIGVKKTCFSHGDPDIAKPVHFSLLDIQPSLLAQKHLILVVRDYRDTIVSWYFQIAERKGIYNGSISEFIKDERFGIRKIIEFYNQIETLKSLSTSFLIIGYEELHASANNELKKVLTQIACREIDDGLVEQAIQYSSFNNLQKLEKEGEFDAKALSKRSQTSAESLKVRKGKLGGFKDYLSSEDLEYMESAIKLYSTGTLLKTYLN